MEQSAHFLAMVGAKDAPLHCSIKFDSRVPSRGISCAVRAAPTKKNAPDCPPDALRFKTLQTFGQLTSD